MKLNTYLAFTNCEHTKKSAIALAQYHFDADAYIKGSYGEGEGTDFRGCSVGCMASGNHKDYVRLFNIDPRIAYVSDVIFEGLPNGEHKDWTLQLFKAIPEGADTIKIYAQFMAKVLRRAAKHDSSGSCEAVAKLHDLVLQDIVVQGDWAAAWAAALAASDASDASAAARAAAWAAASAAAWDARAAAWDAWDARAAAWDAAWAAASDAAWDARAAAWDARAAAWDARAAAWDAAWAAAWDAEYQQQRDDLLSSCAYFGGLK
jgi:hypothetical protein